MLSYWFTSIKTNNQSITLLNFELMCTILTQYHGVPISYNKMKLFLLGPSLVIYHKTIYTSPHSIKDSNCPNMLHWPHNSCILYWHNNMGCYYFQIPKGFLFFQSLAIIFTKTFKTDHTILNLIINATYFNEFTTLMYCINKILLDTTILE